jgi:hypothetical protein
MCNTPVFPRPTGNEEWLGIPLGKPFNELSALQKGVALASWSIYLSAKGIHDANVKAWQEDDQCKANGEAEWHTDTACAPFQAVDAQLHEACKTAKPKKTEDFEKSYGQDNLFQKFGYVSKGFDPLKDSTASKIHEKEKAEKQAGALSPIMKIGIILLVILIIGFFLYRSSQPQYIPYGMAGVSGSSPQFPR